MKLAFLLTQLEAGGAQSRVLQTAEVLRRRGHAVDVYFLYQKREAFLSEPKIILAPDKGAKGMIRGLLALRTRLADGKYDAFVANTAPACILGSAVAASAGVKRRVAVQTSPPSRIKTVYRVLDRIVGSIGLYSVNVANSQWTFEQFSSYPDSYRRRMRIVPNGIGSKASLLSKEEARKALEIPEAQFRFVTVGRLSEAKNHSVLVHAIARVAGEIPDARFAIVGDGELRDELEDLARSLDVQDRIAFIGEVSPEQVGLQLRASNAYVFPSRWESFGLASVEAASAGLPLVMSDLPVHREVMAAGTAAGNPRFVSADDVDAWVAAMKAVRGQEEDELETSRHAGQLIAEEHSIEKHVDRFIAVVRA